MWTDRIDNIKARELLSADIGSRYGRVTSHREPTEAERMIENIIMSYPVPSSRQKKGKGNRITFRHYYYYYFFVGSVSGLFVPVHLLFGPSLRSVPHDYWQWADGTRRMTRGERNPRNRKRLLISYFLRFLWRLLLSSFPSSIRSDRGTEVSEMGMGCGLVERGARVTGSSSSSNNLWALSNWSWAVPSVKENYNEWNRPRTTSYNINILLSLDGLCLNEWSTSRPVPSQWGGKGNSNNKIHII